MRNKIHLNRVYWGALSGTSSKSSLNGRDSSRRIRRRWLKEGKTFWWHKIEFHWKREYMNGTKAWTFWIEKNKLSEHKTWFAGIALRHVNCRSHFSRLKALWFFDNFYLLSNWARRHDCLTLSHSVCIWKYHKKFRRCFSAKCQL